MQLQLSIRRYAIFVLMYSWIMNFRICYNTRNILRFSTQFVAFLYAYLVTPWSRVVLEKLTGSAASQEIPRILFVYSGKNIYILDFVVLDCWLFSAFHCC